MSIWNAPSDRDYYDEPEPARCTGCARPIQNAVEAHRGICDPCEESRLVRALESAAPGSYGRMAGHFGTVTLASIKHSPLEDVRLVARAAFRFGAGALEELEDMHRDFQNGEVG